MLKEWPLVAFTILAQAAAGAILILSYISLFLAEPGWGGTPAARLALAVMDMALVLLGAGAALSFFHLRFPFRARRALSNLRTSWLSREILSLLVLLGLVATADILVRTGHTAGLLFKIVMGGSALAAVLLLLSMSRIYMLKTVPSWNRGYTGLSFFLSAAILGAMTTAWITGAGAGNSHPVFSSLWGLSSLLIPLDILIEAFETPHFGVADARPKASLRPPMTAPRLLHFGKLAFLGGGLVFIFLSYGGSHDPVTGSLSMLHPEAGPGGSSLALNLALLSVVLGVVSGRFLFYGLVPRPGD
jgi:DMSO reductase anchor subunit